MVTAAAWLTDMTHRPTVACSAGMPTPVRLFLGSALMLPIELSLIRWPGANIVRHPTRGAEQRSRLLLAAELADVRRDIGNNASRDFGTPDPLGGTNQSR